MLSEKKYFCSLSFVVSCRLTLAQKLTMCVLAIVLGVTIVESEFSKIATHLFNLEKESKTLFTKLMQAFAKRALFFVLE